MEGGALCLDDWKQLPIPPAPREAKEEIAGLVDSILSEFERYGYPLPEYAAVRVAELEEGVDKKVEKFYAHRE